MLKYHLGCGGKYLPGYVNVDYPVSEQDKLRVKADVYADLAVMKFDSCSVDEIRCHHVLEHFTYVESLGLLIKWVLALRVGGQLLIEVPDLYALSQALVEGPSELHGAIVRLLYGDQRESWAFHKNGWTDSLLSLVCTTYGCTIVGKKTKGSVISMFPNCSIIVCAEKKEALLIDKMFSLGCELLKNYCKLPSERAGWLRMCQQLKEFIYEK